MDERVDLGVRWIRDDASLGTPVVDLRDLLEDRVELGTWEPAPTSDDTLDVREVGDVRQGVLADQDEIRALSHLDGAELGLAPHRRRGVDGGRRDRLIRRESIALEG